MDYPQNRTCSYCHTLSPTCFCSCLGKRTYLCQEDVSFHYQKYPKVPHIILPINDSEPGASQHFQQRVDSLTQAKAEILDDQSRVDKCCQEFTSAIEELVTYLNSYRDYVVSQLQGEKMKRETEIWEAIYEVENSLSEEVPVLTTSLAKAFFQYTPGSLELFHFHIDLSPLVSLVPGLLSYQFTEPKSSPIPSKSSDVQQLIAVFPKEIKPFNLATANWLPGIQLHRPINVNSASSSTCLGQDKVFVCGGGTGLCKRYTGNFAYVLESDGTVLRKPNMHTGRNLHGVLYYPELQTVFVFGGSNKGNIGLNTCEKISIPSSVWSEMPEMQTKRWSFNPCLYRTVVYLCGGNANNVEIYDPNSNAFTLVPEVQLPESEECTAVLKTDSLVVISRHYVSKWSLKQKSVAVSKQHPEASPWSRCIPAVQEGRVYTLSVNLCTGFDLETGAMERQVRISS